jgi:hypothetical protein
MLAMKINSGSLKFKLAINQNELLTNELTNNNLTCYSVALIKKMPTGCNLRCKSKKVRPK